MTKILLIDDEKPLQEEVTNWLMLEGYETISASNGLTGVEAAFRYLPDLIVCDITMPRLDGHGVLLELRSHLATADIPFIFVTARASHEDTRMGMELGADDYITKPFTREELLGAVQIRLEKKALRQQQHQSEMDEWQQAFEQEREQRQLKAKLVAMFSHDFRNPLTSIMSSINIVRDYADRLDEPRRIKHLNRAEAAVRQLVQMLDDMLIVSQMETGNFDFRSEPLNIEAFIQQMVEEFQIIHDETHHIVFESHFTDTVMVDPRLLRQIAGNLISNAIKYSPQGKWVTVLLEFHYGKIILTVQDQGIGIPDADQAQLFTAFYRASNVGTVRGTGLGLAIVKQTVDLHGGSIHLESKVGIGTTIKVEIPVQ